MLFVTLANIQYIIKIVLNCPAQQLSTPQHTHAKLLKAIHMNVFLLALLEGPGRVKGHRLMHFMHELSTYFYSSNCVKGIKTRLKPFKTFAKVFNQTEQVSIHGHCLQLAFIKKHRQRRSSIYFQCLTYIFVTFCLYSNKV